MRIFRAGPKHPAFRGAAGEEMARAVHQYVGLHPADEGRCRQVRELIAEAAPSWGGQRVYPDLAAWGLEQGPSEHWRVRA